MRVAGHPDATAQARRLAAVLKEAGVPTRLHGARKSTHNTINDDIGLSDAPGAKALFEFADKALEG